jgi:hypothetical protein
MSTDDQRDAARRKLAQSLQAQTTQPRGADMPPSRTPGDTEEDRRSDEDTSSRDQRK